MWLVWCIRAHFDTWTWQQIRAPLRAENPEGEDGRLAVEAPEIPSGDDTAMFTRFGGIRGQRFVGIEVPVALDGESEWPA
jgi:hypothetical protein